MSAASDRGFGVPPPAGPPHAGELADLRRRMGEVCAGAVDSLEVAAALEAGGLTAGAVRERYGYGDVFDLAQALYAGSSRAPAEPPAEPDAWAVPRHRHAVHGLLYALPGVCYPAMTPLLPGPGPLLALIGSMVLAWTLSQGMAALGYARMGSAGRAGAARLLRTLLPVGLGVLVVGVAVDDRVLPTGPVVLVFAAAQGCYLLGATVLLVLGAERLLLLALTPAALAALPYLPGRVNPPPWLPLVGCALVAAFLAGALAHHLARRAGATGGGRLPARAELARALPSAVFGLVAAGLLTFPAVVVGVGRGSVLPVMALFTLPLSLSMGAAEWSLFGYRRRIGVLLSVCRLPAQFAARARWALLAAVGRYAGITALLVGAVLAGALASHSIAPQWTVVVPAAGCLALGCALFLALLFQAVATGWLAPLTCAGALVVEAALAAGHSGGPIALAPVQLAVCAGLFAVLLGRCAAVLTRVAVHT